MEEVTKQKVKRFYTKLKFEKSKETGAYVGFVSQDPTTKRIIGVRQNDPKPKRICIVDKAISSEIVPNILYSATLIPMSAKNGFIAIEVSPFSFKASVESNYVPKAVYQVEVRFGNKVIIFDPLDGKKPSVNTIAGCREVLEKRMDIKDISTVVEDFLEHANGVMEKFKQDGFYTGK